MTLGISFILPPLSCPESEFHITQDENNNINLIELCQWKEQELAGDKNCVNRNTVISACFFCLPYLSRGKQPVFSISCAPICSPMHRVRTPLPAQPGQSWCGVNSSVVHISLLTQVPGALLSSLCSTHIPPRGAEVASAVLWVCGAQPLPLHFEEAWQG